MSTNTFCRNTKVPITRTTVPRHSLRYKYTSAPQLCSSCCPYAPYKSLNLTQHIYVTKRLQRKRLQGPFLNRVVHDSRLTVLNQKNTRMCVPETPFSLDLVDLLLKKIPPLQETISLVSNKAMLSIRYIYRRYFQHAHFIPIVGVGKRGEYQLVHCDLPRQHSFGTTLRFTGPVPADSRQRTPSVRNCVTRLTRDEPDGVWRFKINKWTPPRNSGGIQ